MEWIMLECSKQLVGINCPAVAKVVTTMRAIVPKVVTLTFNPPQTTKLCVVRVCMCTTLDIGSG